MDNPLQIQTKKYEEAYQPKKKNATVHIRVDEDLAEIIRAMKKDEFTDRAIRGYAKAFLGLNEK